VALVGVLQLGGEAGQVEFAAGEAFECAAHSQAQALTGDRLAGDGAEDPAQVMRGDGECAGELGQRTIGLGNERLADRVGEGPVSAGSLGPAGVNAALIGPFQRAGGQQDGALNKSVWVGVAAGGRQQQPVLEIYGCGRPESPDGKCRCAAPE